MEPLYLLDRFLVLSHVAAGMAALTAGVGAMLAAKGGPAHRRWGRIFFWGMAWICASTLALMFFRFNFFLLVIAILSFYSALTGYRALYRKRSSQGAGINWIDWVASAVAALAGIGLSGWGAVNLAGLVQPEWPEAFYILSLVFGGGLVSSALPDLISYFRPPPERNWWWYFHMNRMLGAYIAAVTAFLVQNVGRLVEPEWQWVVWITPGIIGSVAISIWINHYRTKFEKKRQPLPVGTD